MLVLRIVAVLLGIGICGSVLVFFLSGERRYLDFAWRLFRYGIVMAMVFFALLALERVLAPLV